ncbi:uncharacterized protein EAE97_011914 [Botrytis byssoidea]|uniref:Uncharacterized protein n=1 Tax=Botrytis byssoidea TaxID=139641 RepID=A0A9P5LPD2_9HELO|nr:uncharacterized protein EAE97_011914 [Botrytis byssoidea]KAF7918143.1 hypothetical protein EAE97_011914 [Botrytis byssoidea]
MFVRTQRLRREHRFNADTKSIDAANCAAFSLHSYISTTPQSRGCPGGSSNHREHKSQLRFASDIIETETSSISGVLRTLPMGKPEYIMNMEDEKPMHQCGDFHLCQFLPPDASLFIRKWALRSEFLSTDINSNIHKMEPRIQNSHTSILTIVSRRPSCQSLFLLIFALLNISSSLLMSAAFICLNYSRNLETPSSTMSRITTSILNFLDLQFTSSHDVILFCSFILATGVFTLTIFLWMSHGPDSSCPSWLLLIQAYGYWIGFNPVELVLCIFPLSVSVWMMLNWAVEFLQNRRNGQYLQQVEVNDNAVYLV